MNTELVVALISLVGVIISVTLSCIISNKINLLKIHNEFSRKLYSKRLIAYLEIYELISGFVKIIKRKVISYDELIDFYDKYSTKDSKFGLLFSYTVYSSSRLIEEIEEIISNKKTNYTISNDLKENILKRLGVVELSMKFELGVFTYTNPAIIMKKFNLPKIYREALVSMSKG